MDMYPGDRFLTYNEFETKRLKHIFNLMFQSSINHLNDYYHFIIKEYKSTRHFDLMINNGYIKCDKLPRRDFKIID